MESLECARSHPEPQSAGAGRVLCDSCIRQAGRELSLLAELYDECLHRASPLPRQLVMERVSGSPRSEQIDDSILDLRHHIQIVLESWTDVVLEGGRHPAPHRSVPHLTRFLATHLTWIATQSPAADFVTEIEELVADARRIVDPSPTSRTVTLGRCVVPGCPGIINSRPQAQENGKRTLRCSAGHSWAPHEWILLRQRM